MKSGWIPISLFLLFTFISNVSGRPGKILLTVGNLSVTDGGIDIAVVRTLRVLLMICGARILMAMVKTEELICALGRIFSPLEKLNVPVRDFMHITGLTLQCFPALKGMVMDEYREQIGSSSGNGFLGKAKMISRFLMPVFVRSIQHPELFFEENDFKIKR